MTVIYLFVEILTWIYVAHDPNGTAFSQIDHFCFDQHSYSMVNTIYTSDCPLNPSVHRPINMNINIMPSHVNTVENTMHLQKLLWQRVTDHHLLDYHARIESALESIPNLYVSNCMDYMCAEQCRYDEINKWCDELVPLCLHAGKCFPRSKCKHRQKCIPGWNDYVKPYQKECIFWHNL